MSTSTDTAPRENLVLEGLAKEIFLKRYAYPGEETWIERAKVIAKTLASVEKDEDKETWYEKFNDVLKHGDFMPGGRIIFGAGRARQNMLNCYQVSPLDDVDSIGKTISDYYKISCGGGGIGGSYSKIRPRGDSIANIAFSAPGAVSVMKMINEIANHVKSGKYRRTALIAILNVDHPDLLEFLHVKLDKKQLNNFNISVGITDKFLDAVQDDADWNFRFNNKDYFIFAIDRVSTNDDGHTRSTETINVVGLNEEDVLGRAKNHHLKRFDDDFTNVRKIQLKAKWLWDKIFENSVECGDPGIFMVDRANEWTNVRYFEEMPATNPCIAKGAFVNTPYGYRKVESLKVGDIISTVDGQEPIKSIEIHNDYPVFKIKFSDGGEQLVTAAHQYHSFSSKSSKIEIKRLDQLKIGDFIRVVAPSISCGSNVDNYYLGLKQGILLGDGSISGKNKKISSNKEEKEYNINLKKLFGEENFIKDNESKNSKSVNLGFTLNYSNKLLEELGLQKGTSETKFIPEKSINDYFVARGVLDGLLATDGNILLKNVTPQARITTCSKQLANDIRRLCLNLGIHAHIYSSFYQDGGTIDERTITRKNIRYDIHIMADSLMKLSKCSRLYELHPEKGNKLKSISKDYCLNSGTYRTRIESIEPFGKADVYDLYCEKSDTWITEGYVQRGCGEIPLVQYGNCCLGHINLSNMVNIFGNDVDWRKLARTIRAGVRFLDNVLTYNHFPIAECKEAGERSRRIGLGVTGLHYLLIKLGYKYGDEKCVEFVDRLFMTIRNEAYKASAYISRDKGPFPAFDSKKYLAQPFAKSLTPVIREQIKEMGIRNAVMLTAAPTGTISMVLGVSTGIEPIFSAMYKRRYRDANVWKTQIVVDPLFKQYIKEEKNLENFVGAYDVTPEEHIRMQATIQRYIDNSLSKTLNLPKDADWKEVSEMVFLYSRYVKGFTIYKAGSKSTETEVEPLEAIPLTKANLETYIPEITKKGSDVDFATLSADVCSINDKDCGA